MGKALSFILWQGIDPPHLPLTFHSICPACQTQPPSLTPSSPPPSWAQLNRMKYTQLIQVPSFLCKVKTAWEGSRVDRPGHSLS